MLLQRTLTLLTALSVATGAGYFLGRAQPSNISPPHREESEQKGELWTCSMHPQVIQKSPGNCPICGMALVPVSSHNHTDTKGITIEPAIVQNMGVRLKTAKRGPFERSLRAVGYVTWAEPNIYDVNLRISGWVEKLYANTEGMRIEKGEKLFDVYSPELQVAVEELISARKITRVDSANRAVADALYKTTQRKLLQWGVASDDIEALSKLDTAPRTVPFRSHGSGDLIEKKVVEGAAITMGEQALRIVDRRVVWLDTEVFPMDLPAIQLGQRVTALVEGSGKEIVGKVIFIDPRVDPTTRTVRVRTVLDNKEGLLRAGMFATVHIRSVVHRDAVLVPREAVLNTGARELVFVSGGEGHFVPREVSSLAENEEGVVALRSGLSGDETVVVSGHFLLDAETRVREGIQKYLKTQEEGDPPEERATPEWQGEVDEVVKGYLELSRRFEEVEERSVPADMLPLRMAVEKLSSQAREEAQREMSSHLLHLVIEASTASLEQQRELFKGVSESVLKLLTKYPPSDRATKSEKLIIFSCPMSKGRWLQDDQKIANPYYGKEMKSCAERVGSIEVSR